MADTRIDSLKVNAAPPQQVQAEPDTKVKEAILTIRLKDDKRSIGFEQGMSKQEVIRKLDDLKITTVSPDFIKDIKTEENGKYVIFQYNDGSLLTMERANNEKDLEASMNLSDGKFIFNVSGNNAHFKAGKNVKDVNVGVRSANIAINTSNEAATNVNLPKSAIKNIIIIPDNELKKDTYTQNVGWFKGDSGFLWSNKTTEISEQTVIEP